jgi:iron-sulfur cluster biosynthesis transcriptional regulator SufR
VARDIQAARDARTKRTILDLLKQEGPSDSAALAARLGVSAMAVRQHLYVLQQRHLVTYDEEKRGVGRPAKLWRLAPAAEKFFPEAYADLALNLIDVMKEAFGAEGLSRVLSVRAQHQISNYRRQMPEKARLEQRLATLASLRSAEGYMAEVRPGGEGEFLFVENHCPICAVARACSGLCGQELEVFRAVLGESASIERTEHILAGARRCAYKVRDSHSLP